jgi:hypothetical protein
MATSRVKKGSTPSNSTSARRTRGDLADTLEVHALALAGVAEILSMVIQAGEEGSDALGVARNTVGLANEEIYRVADLVRSGGGARNG